jgi:aspartate/methionine/tyrosine aminotransferase
VRVPELEYITWVKSLPTVDINLARSGVAPCPASALGLTRSDLVATLPVKYGYAPLREAIASRYGTRGDQVFAVSGGASYANWLACLAALDDCSQGTEVIVERPTYEPLLKIPHALGYRVRRLDRRFEDGYAIDLDRFAALVTTKTRLAIVTNLHNPSGVRIPIATLRAMAAMLARVKAHLLVDEVYLECVFRRRPSRACMRVGMCSRPTA